MYNVLQCLMEWKIVDDDLEQQHHQTIFHMAGDEFDKNVWYRMRYEQKFQFNLILSDAQHTKDAVLAEWMMIRDMNLLDMNSDFAYWFDDLSFQDMEMLKAFFIIFADMTRIVSPGVRLWQRVFHINGWVGTQVSPHLVGVISNSPEIALFPYEKLP